MDRSIDGPAVVLVLMVVVMISVLCPSFCYLTDPCRYGVVSTLCILLCSDGGGEVGGGERPWRSTSCAPSNTRAKNEARRRRVERRLARSLAALRALPSS